MKIFADEKYHERKLIVGFTKEELQEILNNAVIDLLRNQGLTEAVSDDFSVEAKIIDNMEGSPEYKNGYRMTATIIKNMGWP